MEKIKNKFINKKKTNKNSIQKKNNIFKKINKTNNDVKNNNCNKCEGNTEMMNEIYQILNI